MTSSIPVGSEVFPLPEKPKLTGKESVALIIISTWLGEGVHVVAVVPAEGPTPPPYLERVNPVGAVRLLALHPLFIVVVSPCRCEPLRAGCGGGLTLT